LKKIVLAEVKDPSRGIAPAASEKAWQVTPAVLMEASTPDEPPDTEVGTIWPISMLKD
jgi:hypothetical protein